MVLVNAQDQHDIICRHIIIIIIIMHLLLLAAFKFDDFEKLCLVLKCFAAIIIYCRLSCIEYGMLAKKRVL